MKIKIFKFKNINSTNDKAIKIIKNQNFDSGLVYSLIQKKGKGRYGRRWVSLKGNFFGTFFLKIKKNYPTFEEFNLINVKLIILILKKYFKIKKISFKAPNDILINKKKVCGILQEIVTKKESKYLVIGIGLNLISNPLINNYPTTNIYDETKKKPNLDHLLKIIIKHYEKIINQLRNNKYLSFDNKNINIFSN
tara:strand:+ start:721 stop:1302 length:582 start_codon:yes stop_codon:yes gene_type:complete